MKRNILFIIYGLAISTGIHAQAGKVGINTSTPLAMLHVKDSSVVFTGTSSLTPGNTPLTGTGVRMMWYADKGAFRAGGASSDSWDKHNIGTHSFAYGFATEAAGLVSMAGGSSTRASGNYSLATGFQTTARASNSVTIGRYNDSIASSSLDSWVLTDPLFIIGNGFNNVNPSNAMIVLKNANTGINVGNGLPQALLHLKAPEASFDMHIRLENFSNTDYANIIYDGSMKFKTFGTDDVFEWRTFDNNVRMSLSQSGNLSIDGILTQNSDTRLKKNIQPLGSSLQRILSLSGYHYNWIDKSRGENLQTGVMAQEIEKQMPELVRMDESGMRSVNYNGLIPYMIEAMKEQDKKIEALQKEITEIRKNLLQK